MIDSIFALPFICAALYHLGARAMLTQPLWSRYPERFDRFMACAACSGTWYGAITAAVGYAFDVPFLGSTSFWVVPVAGLVSMVLTPIIAAAMERALVELSGPLVLPEPPSPMPLPPPPETRP